MTYFGKFKRCKQQYFVNTFHDPIIFRHDFSANKVTPFYVYFFETNHSLKHAVASVEENVEDANCQKDDGGNDDDDDNNDDGCFTKCFTNGTNSWRIARVFLQQSKPADEN